MIGLEYICKTYQLQNKEVAKMVGVKPGTFNDWFSDRRKIPIVRIEKLVELEVFKGIPKDYFQKKLNRIEEIEVQKKALLYLNDKNSVDDKGNPYNESEADIQILNAEQEELLILSTIKKRIERYDGIYPYDDSSLDFFKDLIKGLNDTHKMNLIYMFIGVLNTGIGIPNYGLKRSQKEIEFIKELRRLLEKFDYIKC